MVAARGSGKCSSRVWNRLKVNRGFLGWLSNPLRTVLSYNWEIPCRSHRMPRELACQHLSLPVVMTMNRTVYISHPVPLKNSCHDIYQAFKSAYSVACNSIVRRPCVIQKMFGKWHFITIILTEFISQFIKRAPESTCRMRLQMCHFIASTHL